MPKSLPENIPKLSSIKIHADESTSVSHVSNLKLGDEIFIRQMFKTDVAKGYELLFKRYYNQLCSHAVRFVYSKETAEDIVGDVFLNFWKNQSHVHIETSYRAYLYASVRNRALNYLKWEFTNDSDISIENETNIIQKSAVTPQTILQFDELSAKIESCVSHLPTQCQKVFMMSRFENKRNGEIAKEIGIALKTVEAHMSKAISTLRKSLAEYLPFFLIIFNIA